MTMPTVNSITSGERLADFRARAAGGLAAGAATVSVASDAAAGAAAGGGGGALAASGTEDDVTTGMRTVASGTGMGCVSCCELELAPTSAPHV
jgi:hypothetical protein